MTYEEALEELAETFDLETSLIDIYLFEEGLDFPFDDCEVSPDEFKEMSEVIDLYYT